jgi:Fur family peroxide stress response transcriptional regulator
MSYFEIRELLTEKGLRVTPQRVVVFETLVRLRNHPTAEKLIKKINEDHPNIATGTVYKILDTLVQKGLVEKVTTHEDNMRYDAILEKHHHLYCSESNRIEDYFDDDLNALLEDYFEKKKIPGFEIKDIKLQITGNFQ